MDKKYVFVLGLSLGLVSSYFLKNAEPRKDTQFQKTVELKPQSADKVSNCADEISKAKFDLLYKTLDIDSASLIKGANGIAFNDPRMFVEMMNGFIRGEVCVDYVKDGALGTNCIQRKKTMPQTASSEEAIPENNIKEFKQERTERIGRDISVRGGQEDSLLSELLAKKGLIPVRDPQTGDISGYKKVTK